MVVWPKHVATKRYLVETIEISLHRRKSLTLVSYSQEDASTQDKKERKYVLWTLSDLTPIKTEMILEGQENVSSTAA
jgi:hypothetical protein